MDVSATDGLEGIVVCAKLVGEARSVDVAETTKGSGVVKGETKQARVEVLV
jgi:hypothetical protein